MIGSYLMEGPLMALGDARRDTIRRMAAMLVASGEDLRTDRDAVRVLMAMGFRNLDVAILAGEARMVAYQEIVAREMGEP